MKKFMQNNMLYVMLVLMLGLSCNVSAMSGGNETENENTSAGSNMSNLEKTVHEEEGGSKIPTKAQATKQRAAAGQTGAPQKQAAPKK